MKPFAVSELPKPIQDARTALFTPCETKDELARWLRVFMGIRLPDKVIVDDESNSAPMALMWEIYDRCRRNDLEGFEKVMAYASRFSGKTLVASILEVLVVLHMPRNVAHMAAIENQAKKAQAYVKDFFGRPILRDFVEGDNAREVKVVAHIHRKTGLALTEREFNRLPYAEREHYRRREQYIKIVICTMAGANGDHVEFMVMDELDVIPRQNIKAYEQAKGGIPVGRDGCTAFTLYTSTRKSRVGLVQKELDRAANTGLQIRHWNMVDVTAPCPPSRSKAEEGMTETYYVNDTLVSHVNQKQYDALPAVEQTKYVATPGYKGCEKCRLFPACKGRLATKQTGFPGAFTEGGTALLVSVPEAASKFQGQSPEFITTEFLCRKPDTSGLVYPHLKEEIHYKTVQEIAAMVAGDSLPPSVLSRIVDKIDLIQFLRERGARFFSGMDFGFSHIFAVVTIAVWGQYAFVVDAIGQSFLEIEEKLELASYLKEWNTTIYGDPENPEAITTFKKRGFKMVDWVKGPGTVRGGIEIVRSKIHSNRVGPTLFFLREDPTVQAAFKEIGAYKFATDAAGEFTNVPEKDEDDFSDALRYVLMNVFGKNSAFKSDAAPINNAIPMPDHAAETARRNAEIMTNHIRGLTGEPTSTGTRGSSVIKKGGFVWDG